MFFRVLKIFYQKLHKDASTIYSSLILKLHMKVMIRTRIGLGLYPTNCIGLLRFYSNGLQKPHFGKKGNIVSRSLEYVKEVDEFQKDIQQVSDRQKVEVLLNKINKMPELLFLLSVFHWEISKIGINQKKNDAEREKCLWKYRLGYIFKYSRIHRIFWDQCAFFDIAQHNHKLNFSPLYIGVLDPVNFTEKEYDQLQHGCYEDTDFKKVEYIGLSRPPFS